MTYTAVCSYCDEEFTVPFQPDPRRPIYCKEHMIYDPTEAYDLGANDGYNNSPFDNSRAHKSVKDSYYQGFNEGRRSLRQYEHEAGARANRYWNMGRPDLFRG